MTRAAAFVMAILLLAAPFADAVCQASCLDAARAAAARHRCCLEQANAGAPGVHALSIACEHDAEAPATTRVMFDAGAPAVVATLAPPPAGRATFRARRAAPSPPDPLTSIRQLRI